MIENKMILDELEYIENDEYDNYLEYLAEEEDRRYEDEIFEKLNGGNWNDKKTKWNDKYRK